jgi:long-chain-fatty-acid--CoA ligase ACSBG
MSYIIILIVIILIIMVIYQQNKTIQEPLNINGCSNIENNNDISIIDLLKITSTTYPTKIALKVKQNKIWKEITYEEYYKKVKNFGQSINYHIGSNINVAIIGFTSPGWFYAHLGTMLNGGISIPIHDKATKDICNYIITDSNAQILIVEDSEQLEKFADIKNLPLKMCIYYSPIDEKLISKFKIPIVSMGTFMNETKKLDKKINLTDIASIIYTLGTTGNPKGTIITHNNIMCSLIRTIDLLKNKSLIKSLGYENFITYLPLNNITQQIFDIYIPIATTSTVWFADKNILKAIIEIKPTIFIGNQKIWKMIQDFICENSGFLVKTFTPWKILKELGLDECKMNISINSGQTYQPLKDFFNTIGIQLYDIYSMSETTGIISISAPGIYKTNSVGLPIMKIKINKNNEIFVKGDNLFQGYYHNNDETKKVITKDKWFKTGDLGNLDINGFLYIIGRSNDLIKLESKQNIMPLQIEEILKEKLSEYYEYIIVVGNKKKYLSILLGNSHKNKNKNRYVNEIDSAIKYVNSKNQLQVYHIKKYFIINKIFQIGKEITPDATIRRNYIQMHYKKYIDRLYVK